MCFGIPMQVERVEEGYAWAREEAHTPLTKIETKLINPPKMGDWLLVFIDSARDIISHERAMEVKQTHQMLAQVMGGATEVASEVDFVLPSQMSAQSVQSLVGSATPKE